MTVQYKTDFDKLAWVSPMGGVHKYVDRNKVRIRLVEYAKEMPLHRCERIFVEYGVRASV